MTQAASQNREFRRTVRDGEPGLTNLARMDDLSLTTGGEFSMSTSHKRIEPHRHPSEWVPAVCAQFSEATGWPLKFVPANHFMVPEIDCDSAVPTESCWQTEVRDGQQIVGRLRLDLPHESHADRTFATVSQLSTILAELLEQVCTVTRQLNVETHELEVLDHSGRSVPQGPEMFGAIKQLLRAGLQLTGFRSACLFLVDPVHQELRLRATHHLESRDVPHPTRSLRDEPPDLQALSSGTRIVLRRGDPQSDAWLPADASIGLCLPVQATCGVLGTLWFFDRRQRSIEPRERQLLDSLSTQIASLLERIALQRESTRHERLRHELRSLNEMDGDSPIKTLRQQNFESSWRVSSRFEIGGDLCEITELSDHEFAILIGDATGNSVPAAVVMTSVHGALAALLAGHHAEARDTARVLTLVNRSLFHTRRLPHFMSLVYGVLDTQSLKFTYSNAGHPSPLLFRDGEVLSLDSRDMLLGIVEESKYTSDTIDLCPRDVLLCYSDGVSESRSVDAEFFGCEGIVRSLGPHPHESDTLTLLNRVWNRQAAFAVPSQADDRSLLIARILPE